MKILRLILVLIRVYLKSPFLDWRLNEYFTYKMIICISICYLELKKASLLRRIQKGLKAKTAKLLPVQYNPSLILQSYVRYQFQLPLHQHKVSTILFGFDGKDIVWFLMRPLNASHKTWGSFINSSIKLEVEKRERKKKSFKKCHKPSGGSGYRLWPPNDLLVQKMGDKRCLQVKEQTQIGPLLHPSTNCKSSRGTVRRDIL